MRAGALLTPAQKEQLKKINEQLSRLGVQFGNNLLADNNAFTLVIDKQEDLAGVPASIQSAASTEAVNRRWRQMGLYAQQAEYDSVSELLRAAGPA